MKMVHIIAAGLAALGLSATAAAIEGDAHTPEKRDWIFSGPFGTYADGDHGERYQLQRGLQVYQELCASCHSLDLISFRNLGEPGGPFWDERWPNPNDNRIVMQIAESYGERVWDASEINDEGDPVVRSGIPADQFPAPFENEQMARASNGGALPPDLSLIVKARHYGADYVYALLMGYAEAPYDVELSAGQHYNEYFTGGAIAMAPPITFDGQVEYADGTEATMEQMAEDVAVFLTWASDPHMEARKQMGLMVLLYLFVFAILVYLAYRQVWANVEH